MTNQFSKAKSISFKHAFSEKGFLIMATVAYLTLIALPSVLNSKNSFKNEVEAVVTQPQQDPESTPQTPLSIQQNVPESSAAASADVKTENNSSSSVNITSSVSSSGGISSQSVVTTETVNGESKQTVVNTEKEGNSTVKLNVSVDPDADTKTKVTERNGRVKVDYRSRSE